MPRETSLDEVLKSLEAQSSKATREGMARYAIPADNALGVTMAKLKVLAKRIGRDHELAIALWATGIYEARMLATLVDEPARVTPAQMDRWCKDFDNWAICDTACFALFDKTPHAFPMVKKWHARREEFEKRAAFALLASIALHDKAAEDKPFLESLPFIERGATDERNFVKKGVSWALRGIGRRNAALNAAAIEVAQRLAKIPGAAPRFIGKDALRELTSPAVVRRLATKKPSVKKPSVKKRAAGTAARRKQK